MRSLFGVVSASLLLKRGPPTRLPDAQHDGHREPGHLQRRPRHVQGERPPVHARGARPGPGGLRGRRSAHSGDVEEAGRPGAAGGQHPGRGWRNRGLLQGKAEKKTHPIFWLELFSPRLIICETRFPPKYGSSPHFLAPYLFPRLLI